VSRKGSGRKRRVIFEKAKKERNPKSPAVKPKEREKGFPFKRGKKEKVFCWWQVKRG